MLNSSSHFALFCLIQLAGAYSVFETTCSKPPNGVNYVSSPNFRGTLDILWSSLFTIFACTWTLQHPNVPEQCHGYRHNHNNVNQVSRWKESVRWKLKHFLKAANAFILTILAPEIIIGVAYNIRLQAHEDHPILLRLADQDRVRWSLTHTYYANMGGFVLVKEERGENVDEYNLHHLSGRNLIKLRETNRILRLPDITEEELIDRAKDDPFIRTISVAQITWSTIQILVRAVKKLSICPLELAVLAFAACAIIIYGLYWDKPKSIGVSTTISLQHQDYHAWAASELGQDDDSIINLVLPVGKTSFGAPMHAADGRASSDSKKFAIPTAAAMLSAMILFGGIHIGAWNFTFPSTLELYLWRCASTYSVMHASIALLAAVFIFNAQDGGKHRFPNAIPCWWIVFLFLIVLLLYTASRLVILVEIFRTLCFLPPDAFVSTWASNLPHTG
ncbi:hypothetical protein ACQKWADRAFT_198059 [Trichoderma austrokoningii]